MLPERVDKGRKGKDLGGDHRRLERFLINMIIRDQRHNEYDNVCLKFSTETDPLC